MASGAVSAFGTFLRMGDGASPENFATIAEVKSISGPKMSMDTIDVTNHSSGIPWREYMAGLSDAGEITFDVNFIPTSATHSASTGMLADMINRTRRNYQIIFPDTGHTAWQFLGFVTGFETGEEIDNVITSSVTIKVTGKPTFTGITNTTTA